MTQYSAIIETYYGEKIECVVDKVDNQKHLLDCSVLCRVINCGYRQNELIGEEFYFDKEEIEEL